MYSEKEPEEPAILQASVISGTYLAFLQLEDGYAVSAKRFQENHADYAAGDHFSDAYGKHHERDWKIHTITKAEYEGYDKGVCDNRGYRSQERTFISEQISEDCSDQCCKAAKRNVHGNALSQNIGNETAYKKAGDRCRGKEGQDGQRFRESYLNLSKA